MAEREPSSFRDPSGTVYRVDGGVRRQINHSYLPIWQSAIASGLVEELIEDKLLVGFSEAPISEALTKEAATVIRPQEIPFVSYPYEWCFGQLRDAALLTLAIERRALAKGFSLKDASAYNVQFVGSKPVLIDSLSFEPYTEGAPWVAYRQFCQHFLAPLALRSLTDARMGKLSRLEVDGIPLDLASTLLPKSTRLSPGLALHIHAHARAQRSEGGSRRTPTRGMSKNARLALVQSLESSIRKLGLPNGTTTWSNYYADTNYADSAAEAKAESIRELLNHVQPRPKMAWDLGANTGRYSRLLSEAGIYTVAWDLDALAVEAAYKGSEGSNLLLPLIQDFSNPSPAIGWAERERRSFMQRGPADLGMALALVHHLAIGNNVPLPEIAGWMASLADHLLIEFVPKEDSQVQRMLRSREDIFSDYTGTAFEKAFSEPFEIIARKSISGSLRTLYLLRRR